MSTPIGQELRASTVFTDFGGAALDPTTVTFKVSDPDGTETEPSIVHDSLGHYHADWTPNEAGFWRWRWQGTGTGYSTVSEGVAIVSESVFVAEP